MLIFGRGHDCSAELVESGETSTGITSSVTKPTDSVRRNMLSVTGGVVMCLTCNSPVPSKEWNLSPLRKRSALQRKRISP